MADPEEQQVLECFLCQPAPDLIYQSDRTGFALCGLGPVVKGYSVVATRGHIRSVSDAALGGAPEFLNFASHVRDRLADKYGSCLLTEHGRMAVCANSYDGSEPHCYHAHFLLFPGVPSIEHEASGYFSRVETAASMREALTLAQSFNEYFLFSPAADRYLVMARQGKLIRQFARMLVANALGRSELAYWQTHPERQSAVAMADQIRRLFRDGTGIHGRSGA